MTDKCKLIYEGKAKKVFSHDDSDKVIIEFKDDATAFNALKRAKFEGKGQLNCQISSRIFELLVKKDIPTLLHLYQDQILYSLFCEGNLLIHLLEVFQDLL